MSSPAISTVNILIVDDNEKVRARLIEQLRYPDLQIVGESSFGTSAVSWASRLDVDIVIVAVEEPFARALRTVELLTTGEESWPIVAVSSQGDRDSMRKAMLAGARDFLAMPAAEGDLRKAIFRVYQREQERRGAVGAATRSISHGTVISVFGVKGGIGKTVTAVNLAVAIAIGRDNQVALVDCDAQFGDCAVMLDLVPERTIVDAAGEVDAKKPHLIDPYLTRHASRLSLLATSANPADADRVTPELVANVLKSLAASHDFVLIDTSPQIDAVTAMAIDLSSIVLMVVTPEVPCIRRTRAALDLLEAAGYSRDKIKVLINRSGKRAEVPRADLETALGYPIYAEIPDDRAVVRSVTNGVPVVMSDPKSDAGRAFLELGRKLGGVAVRHDGRSRRGWFSRRSRDQDAVDAPTPPNPVEAGALLAAWAPAMAGRGLDQLQSVESLDQLLERSWESVGEPEPREQELMTAGAETRSGLTPVKIGGDRFAIAAETGGDAGPPSVNGSKPRHG